MPLKIGGKIMDGPSKGLIVIPKNGEDFAFEFVAVTDDTDFDVICPVPVPPREFVVKTQTTVDNVEDPNYKARLAERFRFRLDWMFLKSIEPSKIEWQTVKMEDPTTYANWRKELETAGLSIGELNQIYGCFHETNMVTQEKLDEAIKRFRQSREQVQLAPQ